MSNQGNSTDSGPHNQCNGSGSHQSDFQFSYRVVTTSVGTNDVASAVEGHIKSSGGPYTIQQKAVAFGLVLKQIVAAMEECATLCDQRQPGAGALFRSAVEAALTSEAGETQSVTRVQEVEA